MAIKTERVMIGGAQYQITQLGALAGRGLQKKFLTAVGPLLRKLISGPALNELLTALGGASDGDKAAADDPLSGVKTAIALAPIAIEVIENIPLQLYEELCDTFASCCTVAIGKATSGQAIPVGLDSVFDDHFAGDYPAMNGWLAHCIRVNGFLGKLGSGSAAQTATPTPTPPSE